MTNCKLDLYNYISDLRETIGYGNRFDSYLPDLLKDSFGIITEKMSFNTKGLMGMAFPGDLPVMILNSKLTTRQVNFYAGHEAVHLLRHHGETTSIFRCYEKIRPNQNPFVEWEANEGAAELLMPYREFIPLFVEEYKSAAEDEFDYSDPFGEAVSMLSEIYGVTMMMVSYRAQSLIYEMGAYTYYGEDIGGVTPLSFNQQRKLGADVRPFSWDDIIFHTSDNEKLCSIYCPF